MNPRFASATVRLVLIAALAAIAAPRPASAGIAGAGATGIQLLNVGAAASDVEVQFRPQGGGAATSVRRTGVAPGSAVNLYLPLESGLSNGAYSASVTGAPEVVALSRTDWSASSGAAVVEGAADGTAVSIPLARSNAAYDTLVNIQNTDTTAPAAVSIAAVRSGTSAVAATLDLSIAAGASATVDLGRHPALAALGAFDGALLLTADRAVAAGAIVDGVTSPMGVAGYAASSVDAANGRLLLPYVPLAAVDAAGATWHSTLALHNVGSIHSTVEFQLTGVAGTCDEVETGAFSTLQIPAGGSLHVDLTHPAIGLPAGCTAAGIVHTSTASHVTGALLVRALDAAGTVTALASYAAQPESDARTQLHAVLMRRAHTMHQLSTTFWLLNPGATPADVTVEVRNDRGEVIPCSSCSLSIPALGAAVPADIGGAMPPASYGSAVIHSDVPLAGIVIDASAEGTADAAAAPLLSTADLGRHWLPLVLRANPGAPAPTRAATPTSGSGTAGPPPTPPTPAPTDGPVQWPQPSAGDSADEAAASGIQVFNRSASNKSVVLRFAPAAGEVREVAPREAAPGAWVSGFLPIYPELANGSYITTVNDPANLGAIGRTDWYVTGGAVMISPSAADDDIALPLALRASERAYVRIANPDSAETANATIHFGGGSTAVAIASGRFVTLAAPQGAALARIAADRPVVASALVFDQNAAKAIHDVVGVGTDHASTQRWITRAYRAAPYDDAQGVTRSSRIVVANPSAAAIDVTAHLAGDTGACAGQTVAIGPRSVAAGNVLAIDLAAESAVPAGCAGPVRLEGSGPFVANAVDHFLADGTPAAAAAVPAVAASEAGTDRAIPVLRLAHTAFRITTDVAVVNPDSQPHTVTLTATDSQGGPVGVTNGSVVLPPGGGHVFRGALVLGSVRGKYGFGSIQSDGPVLVRLDDVSANGRIDASALLAGPAIADPAPQLGEGIIFWSERTGVIADSSGPIPTPVPTPVPAPPLTLLAAAFVDIAGGTAAGCASCDGVYDAADRTAAAASPLPRLQFTVRDAAGRRVAGGRTQLIDGIQIAGMQFPQGAAAGTLTVTFDGLPAGWSYCPNAPLERSVVFKDFELGTARLYYHFSSACVPEGTLPPIVPAALPDLPPRFGAPPIFLPFAIRDSWLPLR